MICQKYIGFCIQDVIPWYNEGNRFNKNRVSQQIHYKFRISMK